MQEEMLKLYKKYHTLLDKIKEEEFTKGRRNKLHIRFQFKVESL